MDEENCELTDAGMVPMVSGIPETRKDLSQRFTLLNHDVAYGQSYNKVHARNLALFPFRGLLFVTARYLRCRYGYTNRECPTQARFFDSVSGDARIAAKVRMKHQTYRIHRVSNYGQTRYVCRLEFFGVSGVSVCSTPRQRC